MKSYALSVLASLAAFASAAETKPELPVPAEIKFNRDVRPILSENCYTCHGPDKAARKGKLRLDNLEGATADIDGNHAVVPGNPDKSELLKRATTKDPEEMMPPLKSEKKLSPRQTAILKKWIEQGAKYDKHWSFIPPVQPEV